MHLCNVTRAENVIRDENYHFVKLSYKIIMFSPIALMALNHITIAEEESPPVITEGIEGILRPTVNKVHIEPTSESFLTVLDDKNRTISGLKKQLLNQKMQLSYYIKRNLNQSKIEEFSSSCTPQASEESLPLNLAINKFCRQAGIKTKLSLLHEHMNRLDYKISNVLRDQEFVLKKIVNKLCEFVKCQESSGYVDFKAEFGGFITDTLHIDLFDKLLGATVGLSRKLNAFKICCDRVVLIEEERNTIVEQVYSMPVEERINCNYLVGIQMEKAQLENQIRRISRHQAASTNRIKELKAIENILQNLQWELNSSFLNNEESCISKMVKKINSEARVLLEMTKEQKRRFECEIFKTKYLDSNRVLLYIKMAADADKMDKKEVERCGIKTEDELRLFEMVKGEVEVLKNKIRQEAEQEYKKLQQETEKLKNKITQVLLDNSRTKVTNESLKQELEELKLERKRGLQRLQQERDAYKSQVEDLQAIREAYAQLVDKQPNTSQMEMEFFKQIDHRDRKILGLENQLLAQKQEINKLNAKLSDQNDQVSVLKRFINLTRPNSPRATPCTTTTPTTNESFESIPGCSHYIYESPISSKDNRKEADTIKLANNLNRLKTRIVNPKRIIGTVAKPHGSQSASKKKSHKHKNTKSHNLESSSQSQKQNTLTCLKIFAHANEKISDKKTDIVRTVVTTNQQTNGNVTTETASMFSIEINCTNGEAVGDDDDELLTCDERELFRDCSVESLILRNRYGKSSKSTTHSTE